MKLSFSLSSKPSSKQQQNPKLPRKFTNDDDATKESASSREFVAEFDATKTLADVERSKKLVIPPLANVYQPNKRMKNLEFPLEQAGAAPNLQFEVESRSAAATGDAGPTMSYGLNIRSSGNPDVTSLKSEDRRIIQEPVSVDNIIEQKLKKELNDLPDGPDLEEYTEMPLESFGKALLAGYGWYEGRGIGPNPKGDVKVVQYKRWNAKEGIGFVADKPTVRNNDDGIDGSSAPKKEAREGKNSRRGGEREQSGRFHVGQDVRIIGGKDIGLKARILEVSGDADSVILNLSRSEEEVKVKIEDIAVLGSVEEERSLTKLKELKIHRSKEVGKSQRVKDQRERNKESKRGREEGSRRSEQKEGMRTTSQVRWLTSHIRVRIISKDLKGGRLYLKKGEVMDVVGPTTCDISMDDSRELVQGVDQKILETALPRRGGPVLVLYGKHKGVYGSLVEKDMDKETGVVRDADTHALLNVALEQVAEYIGDPSLIGY